MLKVENLRKTYKTGNNSYLVLKDLSFQVKKGEFVAVMGPSGSGKTTLLNCISCFIPHDQGKILLNGKDLSGLGQKELAKVRNQHLGFVFQDFNLLDTFSIQDNIFLPLVLSGKKYPEMKERLAPIASRLEITSLLKKFPYEVSGGQKQRTAVARALITEPQLILADEPTGALDSRSADSLLRLFEEINHSGQTILMVTHSIKAASSAGRVLFIKDGEVFHQIYRGGHSQEEMYQKISDTLTLLATRSSSSAEGGVCIE